MKIITICGSLRFKDEIMKLAEKITLQGNCVLNMIIPTNPDINAYTDEDKNIFGAMHKERIKISDTVLVVNIDNYIGSSTKGEIEFAKSLNKEIIYYTDMVNDKRITI